jgi:hypothetical protein
MMVSFAMQKLVQSLWKTVWKFLRKLKVDPEISLLVIYSEEIVSQYQRDTYMAVLFAQHSQ